MSFTRFSFLPIDDMVARWADDAAALELIQEKPQCLELADLGCRYRSWLHPICFKMS